MKKCGGGKGLIEGVAIEGADQANLNAQSSRCFLLAAVVGMLGCAVGANEVADMNICN